MGGNLATGEVDVFRLDEPAYSGRVLAQITDLHIGRESIADEQLATAVAAILALPQAPDAVLISGDLANDGRPEEYDRLRAALAPLPMPIHVLVGNHDDRALLRAALGAPGVADDPIRYAVRVADLRLVACDTQIPGRDDGRLDVAWIAETLAEDTSTPTILAMHHPPIPTGIPVSDESVPDAADRAALAEVLRRSPQVRRVVAGHVHRTAVSTLGGCPVLLLGSTQVALRLDFEAIEFDMGHEPPQMAVHRMVDGELLSHLQPI
jgi:3',5'-cyclic-AMP phosphodiesterase